MKRTIKVTNDYYAAEGISAETQLKCLRIYVRNLHEANREMHPNMDREYEQEFGATYYAPSEDKYFIYSVIGGIVFRDVIRQLEALETTA